MQKIYSLLRDNKQTGPYTLEELVGLSLKLFDLIWVEGKSGGWSYPSEIDALKSYVNQPSASAEISSNKQNVSKLSEPVLTNETVLVKPEIENASRHIYISFPADKNFVKTPALISPQDFLEEEETPEAKLEKKAQELRNKIQAFAAAKDTPKADNELDTKYTRSLDDIKEEYSHWLHQQKKTKNGPSKKMAISILSTVLVLASAYFIVHKYLRSDNAKSEILATSNNSVQPAALITQSQTERQKTHPVVKAHNQNKKEFGNKFQKKRTVATGDAIDAYIDSLRSVEKNKKEINPTEEQTPGDTKPVITKKTNRPSTSQEEAAAPFAQLVQLSESVGSEGKKLTIYNNSNRHIKFVAVDVFYYKANEKLLQKKTLYFNNIAPQSSSPLYVPELKRAASIKYQLGLISTDGGLYYAKQ